ncbi:MAG: hypothetical protein ACI97N_001257 [Cognaticolwellia sp.]
MNSIVGRETTFTIILPKANIETDKIAPIGPEIVEEF